MTGFVPPYPKPPQQRQSVWQHLAGHRSNYLKLFRDAHYKMKMATPWFPGRSVFVVNDRPLFWRVLVEKQNRYPKSEVLQSMLLDFVEDGIFISNGETWKRKRRMIEPALTERSLEELFPLMQAAVERLKKHLDKVPAGKSFDVSSLTMSVAADVICRAMFSKPLDEQDNEDILAALDRYQKIVPFSTLMWALPVVRHLKLGRRKIRENAHIFRNIVGRYVRPRFAAYQKDGPGEWRDILSMLLDAEDPETGAKFTVEELVGEVSGLFLAGYETTGVTMGWSLYMLAECQHIQTRVHEETEREFSGKLPDYSAIRAMKTARDVFRETLRLYPPIWLYARQAVEPDEFRGKPVPSGSVVMVCPWLIQRHESYWDRPHEFDPDRFDTEDGKRSLKKAYLPFNIGPRACMGIGFATQEAVLVLASLVQRYHFRPDPARRPKPIAWLSIRAEKGIHLSIQQR